MHGESVAEWVHEIVTNAHYALDVIPLLRDEFRNDTDFSDSGRAELLRVLDEIERCQHFGGNAVTDRLLEILEQHEGYREGVAKIVRDILWGRR